MLRWRRSFLSLKTSSIVESATLFSHFHSTSVLSDKSRKNFGSDRASEDVRSSKNSSIRFTCTVKEKGRSTAKKTLNNLLFHRGINDPLRNEWNFESNPLIRDRHMKKKTPPGRGKKPRDKKTKRWHREGNPDYDFSTDATTNTFEQNWRHGWTNQSRKVPNSRDSASGYEWTEGWSWTTQSQRRKSWENESCDDEPSIVGSRSERIVLGLPLAGPLKIDDVKNAFRSAALKWHPDKHQGKSQEAAEEKFKNCVDAYKSLCSALS